MFLVTESVIWLSISLIVYGTVSSAITAPMDMKLCHPDQPTKEYVIGPSRPCHRHQTHTVDSCNAEVRRIESRFRDIKAYVCQVAVTHWEATTYFFGAQTEKATSSIAQPPSVTVCKHWIMDRKWNGVDLVQQSQPNVWATERKSKPLHRWPTTTEGNVFNAVLTETLIRYDHVSKKLSGNFHGISTCDIKRGACRLGDKTLAWKATDKIDCPDYTESTELLELHFNENKHLYRVEIRRIGVSIHEWNVCPTHITKCFEKSDYFCTNEGLIFRTGQCVTHPSKSAFMKYRHKNLQYESVFTARPDVQGTAAFATETSDHLAEVLTGLNSDIAFLECQTENLMNALYRVLGRAYPGQILAGVMGGQKAAVTMGDVLLEIACVDVKATLLPSLEHRGMFSTRPLVSVVDKLNRTFIGQIFRDQNVYAGVHFVERYVTGRSFTFRIGERFYSYINYSLSHVRADVKELRPSLTPVNISYEPLDYVSIYNDLPHDRTRYEDYESMLVSINDANFLSSELLRRYELTVNPTSEVDLERPLGLLKEAASDTFWGGMWFVTHPLVCGVIRVLFHLSLVWSVLLTIYALKKIFPAARHNMKRGFDKLRYMANKENLRNSDLVSVDQYLKSGSERDSRFDSVIPKSSARQ